MQVQWLFQRCVCQDLYMALIVNRINLFGLQKMWNNKSMIGAFFVGFVLLNAVLLVPALQGIFAVAPLTIAELLTVYGLSLGTFVVVQILKMIRK